MGATGSCWRSGRQNQLVRESMRLAKKGGTEKGATVLAHHDFKT
jgi:hypothetical protein